MGSFAIIQAVTLLLNKPARGLLPELSRSPILSDHDIDHYAAIIKRQQNDNIDEDTCKNIPILSTGSMVLVQQEDGDHWVYRTIVASGSDEHKGRSYKI